MNAHSYQITGNEAPLTDSEQRTYESLVRLGDSEDLALKTILFDRSRARPDHGFYHNAYCN